MTPRYLGGQGESEEQEEGQLTPTESGSSLPDREEIESSSAEVLRQHIQELAKTKNMLKRKVTGLEDDLLECKTARKALLLHVNRIKQPSLKISTENESSCLQAENYCNTCDKNSVICKRDCEAL